ncbi:MAG: RtcB family protein [Ignavibacteria bacterium]|nr:RtcB family protein [Ignavibacteria bacterium]
MRVPGRVYISPEMLSGINGEELKQVMNVACLPGIVNYSLAMPDIHWGYGFPIGGVAATRVSDGVISPGGVGYDINCGVRLALTGLNYTDIQPKLEQLIKNLYNAIPTGVGARGAISKLQLNDLKKVSETGVSWALEQGFGTQNDKECTEEFGCMKEADFSAVSQKAKERGIDQLGTLGSGNHFLEIEVVREIYDEEIARSYGLFKGQVVVQIHTGSRGFGYQICDDFVKQLGEATKKYKIDLPDRQLACAPVDSEEGELYFRSMASAANFAWTNRQIIMELAKREFLKTLHLQQSDLRFRLLYDVSHNIAKIEKHLVDGKIESVCVHRKGATRAFAPGHPDLPNMYQLTGQPVLIPGDMGRYSFVCAGTQSAMEATFGSSCHGAGRLMSRSMALTAAKGRNLIGELREKGIIIQAKGNDTIAEEMPGVYKDVASVVDVMHRSGIIRKVAKLRPLGVIKG